MRSPPERSAAPGSSPVRPSSPQVGSAAESVGRAVPGAPARDESLQLRALFHVAAALGSALSVEDMADVVVEQVVPALGASGGSLVVRDDATNTVSFAPRDAQETGPWPSGRLELSRATPFTDAVRTGASVVLPSRAAWSDRYPAPPGMGQYQGVAVIPCLAGDTALGAVALGFERAHALTEDDLAFARALAQLCAQALERARLYQAETRARAHLMAVIAAAPVGIVVVEPGTHRPVIANPQAYQVLGQDMGRPLAEGLSLYRPGGAPYPRAEWPLERSLAGETIQGEEIAFVRGDGEARTLSVSASPIRGEAGEVSAAMMVFVDVTERKRREAEHQAAYEEARRAAREREEMVAIVSHDLRSPLNTISMASSLLLTPELSLEKKLIQSSVIRRSVDQMSHLIRDLLDVTRLGAGQLQLHPAAESVRVLLDYAVAAALPLAEAKRIQLETTTTTRAARILADRERVLQILSNLLDNALRHTPEQGRITVAAARAEGVIRFTVADTGDGIPPEELPHIFDRFWQGRRQEREGAGLGLAIVRGLVEAHGGTIDVRSTVGVGTTFTFTLPAA